MTVIVIIISTVAIIISFVAIKTLIVIIKLIRFAIIIELTDSIKLVKPIDFVIFLIDPITVSHLIFKPIMKIFSSIIIK